MAGALVRCSTDKQDAASQRAAITAWGAEKGLDVRFYEEPPGTSGGLPLAERLETVRLLADARAGAVQAIVVTEVSRLNRREAVENFVAICELWLAKVPLYILDHNPEAPVDLGNLAEFIKLALDCGFAAEERRKTTARTKRALEGGRNAAGKRVSVYGKKLGQPGLTWSPEADAELLRRRQEGHSIARIAQEGIQGVTRLRAVTAKGALVSETGGEQAGWQPFPAEKLTSSSVHRRLVDLARR